jgi:hypothetical protein
MQPRSGDAYLLKQAGGAGRIRQMMIDDTHKHSTRAIFAMEWS